MSDALHGGLAALGYETLRPGQAQIIADIFSGQQVVAVMPTGSGKSLCYQLPAVVLHGRGEATLVVSPLIALMKDQVDGLRARGVAAAALTSSDSSDERDVVLGQFLRGELALLYVAPERFRSPRFLDALRGMKAPLGLLAIDEAHCISEWGHDFRPEYRRLGAVARELSPARIAAFTATATPEVRADIAHQLGMEAPQFHLYGFDRPNLHLAVEPLAHLNEKVPRMVELLRTREGGVGVVYASTRKRAEEYRDAIAAAGMRVGLYHAGLGEQERGRAQEAFMNGDVDVMVATNAFGMGVDKSDVRLVIHPDVPRTLEAYYQEAGRAGRDGAAARALILFARADIRLQQFLIDSSAPDAHVLRTVWKVLREGAVGLAQATAALQRELGKGVHEMTIDAALRILERHGYLRAENDVWLAEKPSPGQFADFDPELYSRRAAAEHAKFRRVLDYCGASTCRRQYLLHYFGDPAWALPQTTCGFCDRCDQVVYGQAQGGDEVVSHTLLAVIAALGGRFGRKRVIAVARGTDDDPRLAELPERGKLRRNKQESLFEAMRWLEQQGYVATSTGEYPTVACTAQGRKWLTQTPTAGAAPMPSTAARRAGKSRAPRSRR
ncbi:MAG: ATP-dependent DNA helicase RecQ [Myxococcales bacterium]|nr:ATP-dependent DNA helicase RecQ [Myxococcales bacterium]